MGTPAFAVPVLEALVSAGHEVAAVYSRPDRPSGRGKKTLPTPVKAAAAAMGLPVHQPPFPEIARPVQTGDGGAGSRRDRGCRLRALPA